MGTPANVLESESPVAAPLPELSIRELPRRGATHDWSYGTLLEALGRAHGQAKARAAAGISPVPDRQKPAFTVLPR